MAIEESTPRAPVPQSLLPVCGTYSVAYLCNQRPGRLVYLAGVGVLHGAHGGLDWTRGPTASLTSFLNGWREIAISRFDPDFGEEKAHACACFRQLRTSRIEACASYYTQGR
jgi:hypothetical protein